MATRFPADVSVIAGSLALSDTSDSSYIPRVCRILASVRQQQRQKQQQQQEKQHQREDGSEERLSFQQTLQLLQTSHSTPQSRQFDDESETTGATVEKAPVSSRAIRKRHTIGIGCVRGLTAIGTSSARGGGGNSNNNNSDGSNKTRSTPVLVELRSWAERHSGASEPIVTISDAALAPVARTAVTRSQSSVATQTHHVSKCLRSPRHSERTHVTAASVAVTSLDSPAPATPQSPITANPATATATATTAIASTLPSFPASHNSVLASASVVQTSEVPQQSLHVPPAATTVAMTTVAAKPVVAVGKDGGDHISSFQLKTVPFSALQECNNGSLRKHIIHHSAVGEISFVPSYNDAAGCRAARTLCESAALNFSRDPPSFTSFSSHQSAPPRANDGDLVSGECGAITEAINARVQLPAHFSLVSPFTHSRTEALHHRPSSQHSALAGSGRAKLSSCHNHSSSSSSSQPSTERRHSEFSSHFAAQMARDSVTEHSTDCELEQNPPSANNRDAASLGIVRFRSGDNPLAPTKTFLRHIDPASTGPPKSSPTAPPPETSISPNASYNSLPPTPTRISPPPILFETSSPPTPTKALPHTSSPKTSSPPTPPKALPHPSSPKTSSPPAPSEVSQHPSSPKTPSPPNPPEVLQHPSSPKTSSSPTPPEALPQSSSFKTSSPPTPPEVIPQSSSPKTFSPPNLVEAVPHPRPLLYQHRLTDGENPNLVEEMTESESTLAADRADTASCCSMTSDLVDAALARLTSPSATDSCSLSSTASHSLQLVGSAATRTDGEDVPTVESQCVRQRPAARCQVIVAIDFGTTYSGYAFSFMRQPADVHIMRKAEGGDPGVYNQKIPTVLLLAPDGSFASFGFEARDMYHDMEPADATKWLYFDRFKLSLHRDTSIGQDTFIPAANGRCVAALTVFAHALTYFRRRSLDELRDLTRRQPSGSHIRWVITVPAIWRQHAKQFMRLAAYQAGLADGDTGDNLLIALEPEVASIYCHNLSVHQLTTDPSGGGSGSSSGGGSGGSVWAPTGGSAEGSKDEFEMSCVNNSADASPLTAGSRYLVVDCGGGTVDITVHEVFDSQSRRLKELYKASGGPYGSIGVDLQFTQLMGRIFGAEFVTSFRQKQPAVWIDLMVAFEARKRSVTPHNDHYTNISLPYLFIADYKRFRGKKVEWAVGQCQLPGVGYSRGTLRLSHALMCQLFQPTIDKIVQQIELILCEVTGLQYLYLVGGFSESKLLQWQIKQQFSDRLIVIIPQDVSLVVLRGAVLYGCNPLTIQMRRSQFTYGVGVLNKFLHGLHPKNKLLVRDGRRWCVDVFDRFVSADQSVAVGDCLLRRYTPATPHQTAIVLHIYAARREKVKFVTDEGVQKCATLKMSLDPLHHSATPGKKREIQVRMQFGDTELKATAIDVASNKEVSCQMDFL